jgi:hypothetical protein
MIAAGDLREMGRGNEKWEVHFEFILSFHGNIFIFPEKD